LNLLNQFFWSFSKRSNLLLLLLFLQFLPTIYIHIYIYIYIYYFFIFYFYFLCGDPKMGYNNHHVVVSNYMRTIVLLFPNARKPLCCCFQFHGNLVLLLPIVWKLLCCFKLLENHCVVVSNWMKTIRVACLFVWRPLCVSKRKETVVHNFIMRWRPM
jgi:hypothetical protein